MLDLCIFKANDTMRTGRRLQGNPGIVNLRQLWVNDVWTLREQDSPLLNNIRLNVMIRCALSFLNVRYGFTATVESLNRFKSEPISRRAISRQQSQFLHSCVYERFMCIPTIDLPILLQEICGPILGIYKSFTDTWMWKLGLRPRNSQKRNT